MTEVQGETWIQDFDSLKREHFYDVLHHYFLKRGLRQPVTASSEQQLSWARIKPRLRFRPTTQHYVELLERTREIPEILQPQDTVVAVQYPVLWEGIVGRADMLVVRNGDTRDSSFMEVWCFDKSNWKPRDIRYGLQDQFFRQCVSSQFREYRVSVRHYQLVSGLFREATEASLEHLLAAKASFQHKFARASQDSCGSCPVATHCQHSALTKS